MVVVVQLFFSFDKGKNNIMNKLVENVRHKLIQKTIRANGRKWFSVTKMTIAIFAWASSKIISKGFQNGPFIFLFQTIMTNGPLVD